MAKTENLEIVRRLLGDAHLLAAADHVMVRVAGERIAVILADLLYEIDVDIAEVVSLLPTQRRDPV